jgi:hypothetical protein
LQTDLEILSDFTDQTLEWKFTDKKLGRLLITPDFTERNGSRPETMGLLYTAGCSLEGIISMAMTTPSCLDLRRSYALLMIWQRVAYGALCLKKDRVRRDTMTTTVNTTYHQ